VRHLPAQLQRRIVWPNEGMLRHKQQLCSISQCSPLQFTSAIEGSLDANQAGFHRRYLIRKLSAIVFTFWRPILHEQKQLGPKVTSQFLVQFSESQTVAKLRPGNCALEVTLCKSLGREKELRLPYDFAGSLIFTETNDIDNHGHHPGFDYCSHPVQFAGYR
jgi:hypothetical protein